MIINKLHVAIKFSESVEPQGARWVVDIPLRLGSPSCALMQQLRGVRTRLRLGDVEHADVVVVLSGVTDGVETWSVFDVSQPPVGELIIESPCEGA